jgi:hypothetical protein
LADRVQRIGGRPATIPSPRRVALILRACARGGHHRSSPAVRCLEEVRRIVSDFEQRLMGHYLDLMSQEPAQDAGGHPSPDVHERVGAAWARWDRQCTAFRAIISARLFTNAVEQAKAKRTPDPTPARVAATEETE